MSEVLRLPSGWSESNLNEVAEAIGGGTPSKADPGYWTGGTIPWVSPKDMKSFLLSSSEDRITSIALDRLTLIPKNSVLVVVRSGILSRTLPVALNDMRVTINQDMRAFVPESGIDARFVAWQMVAMEREILASCSKDGTTVASIEGQALARFPLKIAPAAEQTRIVAKLQELLSDLDAGVAELKAAQKKLQHYRQSLLKAAVEGALTASWREAQRTANTPLESGAQLLERIFRERRTRWEEKQLAKFKKQGKKPPKDWQKKYPAPVTPDSAGLPALPEGWVWASMDQLSHFVRNGISKTPNTNSIGYPILRINAVRPMSVSFDEIKNIDLVADEAADYFIENGDLLATRYNGSVELLGVVGLVRNPPSKMLHPDKLIRMKPVVEGPLGLWIEIAANTHYSRKHIVKRVKTTAGQTGISGEDLKKMPIPLPPLTEQGISVELVSGQLATLIEQHSAVERALKQSAAQRQNILRAAFAGQLVSQDPDDEPASVLLERIRSERAAQAATKKSRGRKAEEAAA